MDAYGYVKYILSIILFIALVVPIVIQYILKIYFVDIRGVTITIYGWYILIYLIFQLTFAVINNYTRTKQCKKQDVSIESGDSTLFNIVVVGYRENPEYFRKCLASIKEVSLSSSVHKVIVVIDGIDQEDMYMVDIFREIFGFEGVTLGFDSRMEEMLDLVERTNNKRYICISQPHGGKRSVMYTGFTLSSLESRCNNVRVQGVLSTDSDTIIRSTSGQMMLNMLVSNASIGGVAGELKIFNKYESVMSFQSSMRYWYAFNVERAYQSINNYVLCISGPMGMYQLESLDAILEEWRNQTFLGQPCTYGDDRHLTNKILGLGKGIVYVPIATAETETPETVYKFYRQQIRWCKSAYRELLWSLRIIDKQSLFMMVDMIYTIMYPYIVMGYLLYVLYLGSMYELGLYMTILLFFGVIKSLYGAILGSYENLFYYTYGLIYLVIVFPAKLWALLSLKDTSWGTGLRTTTLQVSYDIIALIIWNATLLCGLSYNIYRTIVETRNDYILMSIVSGVWLVSYLIVYIYVIAKRRTTKKNL